MNRRRFLQILGLAAAAPAAVVRLKREPGSGPVAPVEPAPPRVAPVEIVKTHEKARTPIGGRIVRAEDPWTGIEICEETRFAPLDFRIYEQHLNAQERMAHDLSKHFAIDVDEAAALLRRAADGNYPAVAGWRPIA